MEILPNEYPKLRDEMTYFQRVFPTEYLL